MIEMCVGVAPGGDCGEEKKNTTLPMTSTEPNRTDLHGRPLARICTDLPKLDVHGFAQKTCNRIRK